MTKDKSIFIRNIYYMLAYAFQMLRLDEEQAIESETFDNIHDLFACILARGISQQLKQGLYREYVVCRDDLPVMHGKIDIAGTIRNFSGSRRLLGCEYDEFSEDNLMNQILKLCAVLLLKCSDVKQEYRDDLKKELLFFSGVSTIQPAEIRWPAIHFRRNNRNYRTLLSICQLLLEGILLTTESGEMKLASFIDDQRMSHLYEKFILEYYIREHPELRTRSAQIPWALDNGVGTLLPAMQSDVMLENPKNGRVLIIDAKYYSHSLARNQFDQHTVHSGNLYQIFTYVKNEQAKRDAASADDHGSIENITMRENSVAGMLLYAKTDEEYFPDNEYQMSGNRISVKTLDLGQRFDDIRKQLDSIAGHI